MKCPLPSPDQLRAWAADGENEMCWGLDSVADELERLRGGISNSLRWIPVSERLPEKDRTLCLTFSDHWGQQTRTYLVKGSYQGFCWRDEEGEHVTHWMPLPENPQ